VTITKYRNYGNECLQILKSILKKRNIDTDVSYSNRQSLTGAAINCCGIIQAGWRAQTGVAVLAHLLYIYIVEEIIGNK